MLRWRFLFFLLLTGINGFAQEKTVDGIIFDKDSKDRIASVNIRNTTTGISVYNDLKGQFKIAAVAGNQLIFTRLDYHADTLIVLSNGPVAVYMKRLAIQLRQVTIRDTVLSPDRRLEATKNDYTKIYGSLAYRSFLSVPNSGPAGLSIDALYNSLSRSGRNAEHLKQIIEADYRENVIDYRFNRTLVASVTGLKDRKLTDFMVRYRPGYYIAKTFSDYEFITLIRNNLKRFLHNPRPAAALPDLKVKT